MDMKFKNVIIMMEIGKFYEVYTFETEGGEIGRAREMSRVCNIILTRKNKNLAPSMSNPYMCGFPSHSLTRYVQHLVSHSYTVAVYDQKTMENNKIERVLQGVYSPSVMIGGVEDEDLDDVDRCILALTLERSNFLSKKNQDLYTVVYVCINTTNGGVSCGEEVFYHEQEAVSFIMKVCGVYRPQEVLLRSCLELEIKPTTHLIPSWVDQNNRYAEMGFQQIVLEKVYTERGCPEISVVEEIGLERHPDLVAVLVYTITFLEQHHPLAIYRLGKPTFLQHTDNVSYNTQSLYDLDLFSNQQDRKSLFEILDNTSTPAGKRLLRKTMFAPHHNIKKLQKSYDEISAFVPVLKDFQFRRDVGFYNTDVEHVLRKIQMGRAGVPAVSRFLRMLFDFDLFMIRAPPHLEISRGWVGNQPEIQKVHGYVSGKWDMTLMQSWRSWETDMVWKATPPSLMEKQMELDQKEMVFKKWVNTFVGPDMHQRLVFSEDEAYLSATKKIYNEMKGRQDLRIRTMSSSYRIYHPTIDRYFHERKAILGFIVKMRRQIFQQEVEGLVNNHGKTLSYMVHMSAYTDMVLSNATSAVRFRLHRPVPLDEKESQLSCSQLRHLVVEVMDPQTDYIANNVELTRHHGILLFGQNSAGKCFQHNTKMVLWDGSHRYVQDLSINDVLIGDDGSPRIILALTRGSGLLYEIVRKDTDDVIMTVNEEHILCLSDKEGTHFIEATVGSVLQKPYKYTHMMHQYTRCASMATSYNREVIINREYYMNNNEWNKIYLSFLHCGRRIRYGYDRMVVEPSCNNIVPIIIRRKTVDDFYGFGLDKNQRFLMPDGTVSHNSTLMKSVGVATVMGQCGMFVPCASMRWTPFTSLFTKIGSRDNIWKGRSTFITEMNELRHIIDRSGNRSLILCDELTSGTETFSATGIVASTLETFLENKSKFIMTTHLHTLQQFQTLMTHPQLRVMHFSMEYNKEKQRLFFDRILREGSGKSIYGLEIAEYLGFSSVFLKRAFQYRSGLDPHSVQMEPKKRSRYNAKKWVDVCEQCGSKSDLHTHHVQPQKDASRDGYIGAYHKNRLSNLRILCRACHEKEHY